MIRVSLVTISFNRSKSIENTILSVLKQSYSNIEYILIDGGSTDGTMQVVDNYRTAFAYIESQHDRGIAHAFNKGFFHATGDLIGFVNAGDTIEHESVACLVDCYQSFCEDTDIPCVVYGKSYWYSRRGPLVPKNLKQYPWWISLPFSHGGTLINRAYFTMYGWFNETYNIAMDIDYLLRGHGKARYLVADCDVLAQETGGISDRHRINSYREYARAASTHFGSVRSYLGFVVKTGIYFYRLVKDRVWRF